MTFLRPRAEPALVAEPAEVLGYVVVMFRPSGIPPTRLTNADLMDRETAEHEVQAWRRSEDGAGCRYEICPVIGGQR